MSDGTRRRDLDAEKLARVKDAHVRMALRLQAAFGLRREEAIKFRPRYADRGDHIAVKASTAKGGRPRDVPVLNDEQRRVLDEARTLAGAGAMIPPERNYAEQKRVYMDETKAAGLDHMHGLRHYSGRRTIPASRRETGGSRAFRSIVSVIVRDCSGRPTGRHRAGSVPAGCRKARSSPLPAP